MMMQMKQLIHTGNIIHATHYLLHIDNNSILPIYQNDAHRWIFALCNASERYQQHLKNLKINPEKMSLFESNNVLLQQAQNSLINHAIHLAEILSDPAKATLIQQLLQ